MERTDNENCRGEFKLKTEQLGHLGHPGVWRTIFTLHQYIGAGNEENQINCAQEGYYPQLVKGTAREDENKFSDRLSYQCGKYYRF